MLEIKNLKASVSGQVYLNDVTFTAEPGKIYILMGRTGAGKTSLMRAIAGLLSLDSGQVIFNGADITATPVWKRDIALVYQQFINYPNKTVQANVELPLRKLGLRGQELASRVDTYLAKVGLTDFRKRRPGQLSGGQQQRLALARSMARQTRILMLDEPLMNLDFKLREQLREEFLDLFSGSSETITIYATTEISEAMMLGYQVLVMHEGRLLQIGTPAEVYDAPRNTIVAQVVNDPPMTILSGRVLAGQMILKSGSAFDLPPHLESLTEGEYRFGIRASDIVPTPGGRNSESCTLEFVEVTGSETVLYATSDSGELVIQVQGIHDYALGSKIDLTIRMEQVFAFDVSGELLLTPRAEGR